MTVQLSIGEVAALTGLPVKTIRFYTDEGLVPPPSRTDGGHRRYGDEHVARLDLIRALRELDVDLPSIRSLLDRELDLDQVLRAQLAVTESHLRRLQRRAAILQVALQDPTEAMVLRLPALARLEAQERSDLLDAFWDHVLADAPGDPALHERFRGISVPDLPDDAGPHDLAAWLELADLATDPSFQELSRRSATWLHDAAEGPIDVPTVMADTHAALDRVVGLPEDEPVPDGALVAWVGAHATALRRADDHAFRRWLLDRYEELDDPRFSRFWELVGQLGGGPPMPGAREHSTAVKRLIGAVRGDVTG